MGKAISLFVTFCVLVSALMLAFPALEIEKPDFNGVTDGSITFAQKLYNKCNDLMIYVNDAISASRDFLKRCVSQLKILFSDFPTQSKLMLERIGNNLRDFIFKPIGDFCSNLWNDFVKLISKPIQWFKDIYNDIVEYLGGEGYWLCADGEHIFSNGNHKCIFCPYMSTCYDGNSDEKCDFCGLPYYVPHHCHDCDKNTFCDYCGVGPVIPVCFDIDRDTYCNYCGEKVVACSQLSGIPPCSSYDTDGYCDSCGLRICYGICLDGDDNGYCDRCGVPFN